MKRLLAKVLVVGASLAPAAAGASQSVPLSQVASECGYRWSYIGAQQAVVLSRHGASIKIRPGVDLYEYNDREVPVDGPTPYYSDGDIWVSGDMDRRLQRYVSCVPGRKEADTPGGTALAAVINPNGGLNVEKSATVTAVDAHQIPEQSEIAVSGNATPNARLALTLRAISGQDLPEVVVSRTRLRADDKGRFSTVISTASLFYPGSLVRLTAETDSGSIMSVPVSLEPPNFHKSVPGDEIQKSIR